MSDSPTINYTEIFGNAVIESSADLLFVGLLARVLNSKGYRLSLQGSYVNFEKCNESVIKLFDNCVGKGHIVTSYQPKYTPTYTEYDTDYDLTVFDLPEFYEELVSKDSNPTPTTESLPQVPGIANVNYSEAYSIAYDQSWLGNTYLWRHQDAYARVYEAHSILKPFNRQSLVHTVRFIFLNHVANIITQRKDSLLVMDMRDIEVSSSVYYRYLIYWLGKYPTLNDYIQVELDTTKVDYDYDMFLFNAYNSNTRKVYTIREKRKLIESLGIAEGSICVMWERNLPNGSIDGNIDTRVLVRFDGYDATRSKAIFTQIPEPYTLEERRTQYNAILPENRYMFQDMLKVPSKNQYHTTSYSLLDLGIAGHLFDEPRFLMLLDVEEQVEKLVTVENETMPITMSAPDAIYWVLKQRGTAFDEDNFRNLYFPSGSEPIYSLLEGNTP